RPPAGGRPHRRLARRPVSRRGARGLGANLVLALASALVTVLALGVAELAVRRARPRYLERVSLDGLPSLPPYSPPYGWTPPPPPPARPCRDGRRAPRPATPGPGARPRSPASATGGAK